jgi:predicted TIM-barrel fold metal-dependent hydrolase
MIIDMFTHISPEKYRDAMRKYLRADDYRVRPKEYAPSLTDVGLRLKFMDIYGSEYVQVLTNQFFSEEIAGPKESPELARIGNDAIAEIIAKYPDRFIAGAANLPMNNTEAALKEMDRAIKDMGFKGIMVCSNINGKALDAPEFMPIYDMAAHYDVPIWIHPSRPPTFADYPTEEESKYNIYAAIGWPYDMMVAIVRLVCCGVLEKHPNLKIYAHLTAGGIAYYADRFGSLLGLHKRTVPNSPLNKLSKPPVEYLRMIYSDTEMSYTTAALECTNAFFGAEHMVYSSGMPYGTEFGHTPIGESIKAVKRMHISDSDKQKIFEGNARKLLHLESTGR